jgi:DNA-directed RNA polymerase specialized sigma24 family protein
MNKNSTPEHLNASECNRALEAFVSDEENILRLYKIARRHAGSDLDAEELVQDAFTRILDGDRAWPRGLGATPFVIKVIQSIASERREKQKRRKPFMTMTGTPPEDILPCLEPTAADMLELLQQDAIMRAKTLKHFEDDPELRMLAEALLDGWEKQELLSLFDQDEPRYKATRKRFRRRMQKLEAALTQTGGPHDQDHAQEVDDC